MTKKIPLVGIYGEGKYALVDDEDFEELSKYRWFLNPRAVTTNIKSKKVLIHRLLMNPPKNMVVDHINGDILDNRKSNLRVCTQAQNSMNRPKSSNNTSGYKGVCFSKSKKKFSATYSSGGTQYHIGYFDNPEDAANAYDYYVKNTYGEFAKLNFPEKLPTEPIHKKLSSKYRGVSYCTRDKRYSASFTYEKQRYLVGYFLSEEEAIIKLIEKAREIMSEEEVVKRYGLSPK